MTTALRGRLPDGVPRGVNGVRLAELLLLPVAFAARIGVVYQHGGSIFDSTSYDPSVYYAAADALLHGRVPYVDFTLLHPPGLMLALTPFALLGSLTTDHLGFVVGNVSWMALGAVNALLVVRVAKRFGARAGAAIVGGVVYATCFDSLRAEYDMRLEVLGNFLLLLGLLAYTRSAQSSGRTASLAAGAALAGAASVKIWYAVALVLVLAWHLVQRRPRHQLVWASAGAAAAAVVINGPFAILAGGNMLREVVLDQFGRRHIDTLFGRVAHIATTVLQEHRLGAGATALAVAVSVAILVAVGAGCLRRGAARLPLVLLLSQLAVLLSAPMYFSFYADYLMPAFAVCVAVAVSALAAVELSRTARAGAAALTAACVAATAGLTIAQRVIHPVRMVAPAPDAYLQEAAGDVRCVQSDSPMPLIALNVLTHDLRNGCRQWVDVSGRTYGPDRTKNNAVRRHNQRWQRDLLTYLRSGALYVVVDYTREGIDAASRAELAAGRVVSSGDGLVLRAPR